MFTIKAVIGSNFGDEGKGLMTDYFCSQFYEENRLVLNIRFNGGAQAGHTVTEENRRQVFSHIGSGSFINGTDTLLSSFFFVDPVRFNQEYETLKQMGCRPRIFISDQCRVVVPYDCLINQLLESMRGSGRHGSCGFGINECRKRNQNSNTGILVQHLKNPDSIESLLSAARAYYEALYPEALAAADAEFMALWYSDGLIRNFIEDSVSFLQLTHPVDEALLLNSYDCQVYEGAQGLLLDMDHVDYMPHLTPSNTGLKNICRLIRQIRGNINLETCYVTRSYFTRHGAGRFETEVPDQNDLRHITQEHTNVNNQWQGNFRYGYFDRPLYESTILRDLQSFKQLDPSVNASCSAAITHLNTTDNHLVLPEHDLSVHEYRKQCAVPFERWYFSYSPRREDVTTAPRSSS